MIQLQKLWLLLLYISLSNSQYLPVPPGERLPFRTLFYIPQEPSSRNPNHIYPRIFYFSDGVTTDALQGFFGSFTDKNRRMEKPSEPSKPIEPKEVTPLFDLPSLKTYEETFKETASEILNETLNEDTKPPEETQDSQMEKIKPAVKKAMSRIEMEVKKGPKERRKREISAKMEGSESKVSASHVREETYAAAEVPLVDGNSTTTEGEELPKPEQFLWRTTRPQTRMVTIPRRRDYRRPFVLSAAEIEKRLEEERMVNAWKSLSMRKGVRRISAKSKRPKFEYDIIEEDYLDGDQAYYEVVDDNYRRDRDAEDIYRRDRDVEYIYRRDRDIAEDNYRRDRKDRDVISWINPIDSYTEYPLDEEDTRPKSVYARRHVVPIVRPTVVPHPSPISRIPIIGRLVNSGSALLNMINPFKYFQTTVSPPQQQFRRQPISYIYERRPPSRPVSRRAPYDRQRVRNTYTSERGYPTTRREKIKSRYEEEVTPYYDDYDVQFGESTDQSDLYERSKYVTDFPLREDLYVGKDGNIYIKGEEDIDYDGGVKKTQAPSILNDGYEDELFGLKMYGMEKPLYNDRYEESDSFRPSSNDVYRRRRKLRKRRGKPDDIDMSITYLNGRPQSKLANV